MILFHFLFQVSMSIMGARPYSHPKATSTLKAIDVGQFPTDSDQTILPSDRSREGIVTNPVTLV